MVTVASLKKNFKKLEGGIAKTASITLKNLKKEHFLVHVFLIGNEEIRRLNKIFKGKDKPTNVLSFNEPADFPHPELKINKKGRFLGEIYLAPRYIKSHKEDINRLAVHGILHLAGYTHDTERDKIRTEKKEKEVLEKISEIG